MSLLHRGQTWTPSVLVPSTGSGPSCRSRWQPMHLATIEQPGLLSLVDRESCCQDLQVALVTHYPVSSDQGQVSVRQLLLPALLAHIRTRVFYHVISFPRNGNSPTRAQLDPGGAAPPYIHSTQDPKPGRAATIYLTGGIPVKPYVGFSRIPAVLCR